MFNESTHREQVFQMIFCDALIECSRREMFSGKSWSEGKALPLNNSQGPRRRTWIEKFLYNAKIMILEFIFSLLFGDTIGLDDFETLLMASRLFG